VWPSQSVSSYRALRFSFSLSVVGSRVVLWCCPGPDLTHCRSPDPIIPIRRNRLAIRIANRQHERDEKNKEAPMRESPDLTVGHVLCVRRVVTQSSPDPPAFPSGR
jgi:hypothetical protein